MLALTVENSCLNRKNLVIIGVYSQDAVYGIEQLRHIVGSNMYIDQVVEEVERNRELGNSLFQNTLLLCIILLLHVNHVHVHVAVFLIHFRFCSRIQVFLKILQSLRILFQLIGRYSGIEHHRGIPAVFREKFTTENKQLGHIDIS